MISDNEKKFIEENIHNIEQSRWQVILTKSYEELSLDEMWDLAGYLWDILVTKNNPPSDWWLIFMYRVQVEIHYELNNKQSMRNDPARCWSRFDDFIQRFEHLPVSEKAVLDYCIKHKEEMGLRMEKLPKEYMYLDESMCYDLGWFNRKRYAAIYLNDDNTFKIF